ncbi:MAG: hypothetical protein H0T76_27810 [Nannocystis sp.]|nr:hypothetical protein [Nannocystis sp.]MBA3550299.1 hypothetical protein [Nannocystis sp.]
MLTLVYPYDQIRVTGDRRWTARLARLASEVLSGVEADELVWTLASLSDPRALARFAASLRGLGASPTSPRRAT